MPIPHLSGRDPGAATGGEGIAPAPSTVEAWLAALGLAPAARAERDGVVSWDLVLDGRRRPRVAVTLIYDRRLALVVLVHFAPPLQDGHRRVYRQLLRWNDEYPFVKFALAEDERPLLSLELPAEAVTLPSLGLAIARLLAVADRLWGAGDWLWGRGPRPAPPPGHGPGIELLERFGGQLGELLEG